MSAHNSPFDRFLGRLLPKPLSVKLLKAADYSGQPVIYLIYWRVVSPRSILGPFRSGIIAAALVISFAALAGAQNLTTNGNFETGPFDSNGTVTRWTASTNLIANTNEGGLL